MARHSGAEEATERDRAATYREVFGVREFRYLFSAYLLSLAGDQLAKVALSIVVFERTGSALLSAITFAVGYLPWLIGGPLLSVYADRLPRRQVMIGCDLIRMLIIGALAIPGIPLGLLVGMLFVANLFTPPFEAARAATTPEILSGDRYAVGLALSNISAQLAQVGGFVAGGALVLAVSARGALLIDAATFAVSAVLLWVGVRVRPAAARGERLSLWADAKEGIAVVFGTPRIRRLIAMLWVAAALGFAPEGLAAAYAAELDKGAAAVGLLLAANPLGLIIGGLVMGRMMRPSRRQRLLVPLAVLSVLALVPAATTPWLPVILALLFLSGVGFSFVIPLNVLVVQAVPDAARARAFGVIATGLQAVQGLGIVAAGLVATVLAPSVVVTLCGAVGSVIVLAIGLRARAVHRSAETPAEA
ncbi:MAG: MFS transporter [Geodermatophilaceae bacterium]|nr:MFS transporter [Geodermatophilaceae bacterium]